LSEAVNAGEMERVRAELSVERADLVFHTGASVGRVLKRLVLDGCRPWLERVHAPPVGDAGDAALDDWACDVLESHARFQVLCAVRSGAWGVEGLNRRIAYWLTETGMLESDQEWVAGRPVLVTRNDYGLGLMN